MLKSGRLISTAVDRLQFPTLSSLPSARGAKWARVTNKTNRDGAAKKGRTRDVVCRKQAPEEGALPHHYAPNGLCLALDRNMLRSSSSRTQENGEVGRKAQLGVGLPLRQVIRGGDHGARQSNSVSSSPTSHILL